MTRQPALCQCVVCMRYLASDRDVDAFGPQACEECMETENHRRWVEGHGDLGPGIPLAKIRGPEGLGPLSVELLGLLVEECGEVGQRVGKVLRWGWDADFAGTTQRHKLEVELGDVLAAMILAIHNDLVDECGVTKACFDKLTKLREDAAGPRQRLRHAGVPKDGFAALAVPVGDEDARVVVLDVLRQLLDAYVMPRDTAANAQCECSDRPHAAYCPARST